MAQVLFDNCTLLDTPTGQMLEGRSVLVVDDRMEEVSDSPISAPNARRIDVGGKTLMPGMIDAHVHCTAATMNLANMAHMPATLMAHEAAAILRGMLARGFTTIRDAAGADRGLAAAVDKGLVHGPRIYYAGRALSQTGGHGDLAPIPDDPELCACSIKSTWMAHVVDGVDGVRRAAREELRRGAHAIKIMASGGVASPTDPVRNTQYSREELRAIVEETEAFHTYAFAHAYSADAITRAIEAGVRTIEHGNLIDDDAARLMAERGAFIVPTLVTYHTIREFGPSLGFPEVSLRKADEVLDIGLASLEICKRAGVSMGFGTDLLGEMHPHQSREFLIRSEVFSPWEIIRDATVTNARILRMEGQLGVVAPGALADVLVVDGDPTRDLGVLQGQGEHIPFVMKAGEILIDRL